MPGVITRKNVRARLRISPCSASSTTGTLKIYFAISRRLSFSCREIISGKFWSSASHARPAAFTLSRRPRDSCHSEALSMANQRGTCFPRGVPESDSICGRSGQALTVKALRNHIAREKLLCHSGHRRLARTRFGICFDSIASGSFGKVQRRIRLLQQPLCREDLCPTGGHAYAYGDGNGPALHCYRFLSHMCTDALCQFDRLRHSA